MKTEKRSKFKKAQKRVQNIKGFYDHLKVYVIANAILFLVKDRGYEFFVSKGVDDPAFFEWLGWNMIITPVLWGVGLLIHGVVVFKLKGKTWSELKPKFIKDWEQKQLQKFMKEDGD